VALGRLLRAGVIAFRGDCDSALRRLNDAEQGFITCHMSALAAARRHRGELLGGAEGAALIETADQFIRS
jgi:hypothetical protein